ncbi:MAG: bifunctional UDP-N-acetylmuramoyl-tripeptide:D-alanyl-D-alanine ligase/alanine racemase [Prevotellaceae bacterium]|jgi:alanine racemase|nr:bifunctional UDP-N-acetylmuramoyl-tripeptide:D-alanyl-D-alanine ligase/alanine racemase [Prevotellaceae bacterium]
MSRFRISEIVSFLNAQRISGRSDDAEISCLLTDSRYLRTTDNCLFFALKGAHGDSPNAIEELYNKGVRHFVVQDIPEEMKDKTDADFLLAANPQKALRLLAEAHRKQFTIPVVGITGSAGKTMLKEWLAYLLAADRKVVKSPKGYHHPAGVPLSVWEMQPGDDIAIFGAGLSKPGDMQYNQAAMQPTVGIFTNIRTAHDENFTSIKHEIDEQLKLFTGVQQLIYCADHADIREQITNDPELKKIQAFTWGKSKESTLRLMKTTVQNGATTIMAKYRKDQFTLTIPVAGKAAVENAMHCWAFMLLMKYQHAMIAERMQTLPAIEKQMELKEAVNNCSVISDSYPSDFHSLQRAVVFLNQQLQHAKKTVILFDYPPCGNRDENEWYADIARLLAENNVSRIIGIGSAISQHADKFSIEKSFFPDVESFLEQFPLSGFRDETILLKGARTAGFEKIDNALQWKTYKTKLEVNLNAVSHNLNYFRSKLTPGVGLMAMVKAFAYGSGSFEIADLLQSWQVDYLGVASVDEGVELREAGIKTPIMVINPEEQNYGKMTDYHLEPEIYNLRTWHDLLEYVKRRTSPAPSPIAVHIKLDTGMHRLGIEEKDLPQFLQELKETLLPAGEQPAIRIASVFSHLAASDNPQLDRFTHRQLATFRRLSSQVQAACNYPVCRHLANSAGISRFPDTQFNMVRLGIGLYGIGANETEQQRLQNVSTMKTVISQIKRLPAGETVGYNRNHKIIRDTCIGILPIGYADGLPRKFGNGKGSVWINEKLAPVIGNVCMDMCMIDLTGIPAQENDEVIIFGEVRPVAEVAKILETIPYEVFTNISRRVKRVYYQE